MLCDNMMLGQYIIKIIIVSKKIFQAYNKNM